jgi:hypothetical protein
MNNPYIKFFGPHLIAVVILMLFSMFYFSPAAMDGLTIGQSDVIQAGGTQAEIKKFSAQEGREMLWTNGIFAGMPTFQVYNSGGNTLNYIQRTAYDGMRMFQSVTSSYGLLFAGCLGFYFLLISLGVDWRISILGGILYGLNTSNMIWLHAGHVNKIYVLTLLAPTLAGILMIFRGKYLWGAAITALFTSMQILANHIQITYYFYILIAILALVYFVEALKNKTIAAFGKSIVTLGLAALLGILPNMVKLWTTYDYAKSSIRGKSEVKSQQKEAGIDGLSKDYSFDYSMGKMETFSLLVPNFMGADSGHAFAEDEDSESSKAIKNLGNGRKLSDEDFQQLASMTTAYWGEQASAAGAFYFGAALVFLFFLGFFQMNNAIKWWSIASIAVILMISWGKNFGALNFFLFDHFPMFNKFRDSKMIISIAHVIVVLMAILGLNRFFSNETSREVKQKQLYMALGTSSGLVVCALLYGMFGQHVGQYDEEIRKNVPELMSAIQKDRSAYLQSDALRSLMYIVLTAGLLWFLNKGEEKTATMKLVLSFLVGLICLIDVVGIDKRYLANDDFQATKKINQFAEPRAVDKTIMADKDLSFRVLDLSRGGNPFSNALASNFHKSMGGYHAAKMMTYQDVVEKYLNNPGEALNVYGMFNTKYIITKQGNADVALPIKETCGNAWFVKSFQLVDNAQTELDSLKNLKPKEKAILQVTNAKNLEGFNIQYDSTNTIKMTKYIPDDMTYTYNAKTEQLAIFSEIYYPNGWTVTIDGQKIDNAIMRANYTLRAMKLPAGQHTLQMKFEPESYYKGQLISRIGNILLSILFFAGLFFLIKGIKKD